MRTWVQSDSLPDKKKFARCYFPLGEDFMMFAGGRFLYRHWTELYSFKAGIHTKSHLMSGKKVLGRQIIQTSAKTLGGDAFQPCGGEDGGKILAMGGLEEADIRSEAILVFSFQHGWFEAPINLPRPVINGGFLVLS